MVRKKLTRGLLVCLCLSSYGFASEIKTQLQKESYSIGFSTGSYISSQLFEQTQLGADVNVDMVIEGFVDALKKQQKLNDEDIITNLNNRAEFLNEAVKNKFDKELKDNLENGKQFLAKNAKNKKVSTTKTGLQYEVLSEGKGKKPKEESIVLINYKAYLVDGTVFDDTYERETPSHLSMINIVDGLKEGLMLMSEGSKYKLFIPSELAYGNVEMREIPPGSTVIFEVDLLKVLQPGELENSAGPLDDNKSPEKNINEKKL